MSELDKERDTKTKFEVKLDKSYKDFEELKKKKEKYQHNYEKQTKQNSRL